MTRAIETKADMADMLERFFGLPSAEGHPKGWEWDDFEHCSFTDPELEAWRQRVLREVSHLVAPSRSASADKIADDRIRRMIDSLRQNENA